MRYIRITTPVARFYTVWSESSDVEARIEWVKRYADMHPTHHISTVVEHKVHSPGMESSIEFECGPEGIAPAIWTHVPVPLGMPIAAINKRFEERAARLLSDVDHDVDLSLAEDNRYLEDAVRCAWMMYVDLAIDHYTTAT